MMKFEARHCYDGFVCMEELSFLDSVKEVQTMLVIHFVSKVSYIRIHDLSFTYGIIILELFLKKTRTAVATFIKQSKRCRN